MTATDNAAEHTDWRGIEASDEFRALLAAKGRFIVPATVFFIVYYFALPVLVGYAPQLMTVRLRGGVNVAYLFALSQFFMAWTLAGLYLRSARRWDRAAASIAARHRLGA